MDPTEAPQETQNSAQAPETAPAPEAPTAELTAETAAEAAPPSPVEAPADAPAADEKTEAPAADADRYTLRDLLGDICDLAESVIAAIFTVMLVFTYLLCTANVEGDSMVPTLEDGDRLLVSRIGRHYQTGDILILDSEASYLFDADGTLTANPGLGKEIVKRLIAQSGQEINIDFDEGIVYVDGKALDEPYTSTLTKRDNRAFTYPMTVPEGYVFVLGDNRHISKDSRHPEIGLIPAEDITGKVLLRVMPLEKFGRIDSTGGQQAESQRD